MNAVRITKHAWDQAQARHVPAFEVRQAAMNANRAHGADGIYCTAHAQFIVRDSTIVTCLLPTHRTDTRMTTR